MKFVVLPDRGGTAVISFTDKRLGRTTVRFDVIALDTEVVKEGVLGLERVKEVKIHITAKPEWSFAVFPPGKEIELPDPVEP